MTKPITKERLNNLHKLIKSRKQTGGALREEVEQDIKELRDFIDSIQDEDLQYIFILRYDRGKTWTQIAMATNYADESTPRRRCDRHLKKMGGHHD